MKAPLKKFKNPRARHNFQGRPCSILAVGSYVPDRILSNADFEQMVDTSDEWITTRTGIKERRIAAKNECTSDLAMKAAQRAMTRAKVKAEDIDVIVLATITPDMPFPSTACIVQEKIGAHRAAAFDVQAACSGFIFGVGLDNVFFCANGGGSPFDDGRAPSQAGSEHNQQNQIAALDASRLHGVVQGDGDGRGGGVAVFLEIDKDLFRPRAETFGDCVNNTAVGLVRDDAFDL